jgi:Flp pilus assembly protein CpaB
MVPRAGDRVDVMVTFPGEVLGEPTTMTILRSAKVASVTTGKGATSPVASELMPEGASQSDWSVTLFVTPAEAERLAMAESLGRVAVVVAPVQVDEGPLPIPVTPSKVGS